MKRDMNEDRMEKGRKDDWRGAGYTRRDGKIKCPEK